MINKFMIFPALCLSAFLIRCSIGPFTGGSDNPDFIVVGTVVDASGQPAQNAVVTIAPASYNPVEDTTPAAAMMDTTDASGAYRVAVKLEGSYTVQAVHLKQRTRLLMTGIRVWEDTTHVAAAALVTTGTIKVSILTLTGINTTTGYIYVPGTALCTFLNKHIDAVVLDSVPAGTLPAISYAATNTTGSVSIRYNVPVLSGDTSFVSNLLWKYSKTAVLNTTPSGADIAGTVEHFPVLIRLTSSNFNFSQAQTGGADIRFTKSDNTFLPYEIERWDSVNSRAEIWVKVDTVYGNNDNQSLIIYWGNAAASTASNAQSVFDTNASKGGYQGVWHLSQAGNTTATDATANGYDGTSFNMTAASAVPGMIGDAQEFNGSSSYIRMQNTSSGKMNFPENGYYTISAWVYCDTSSSSLMQLIAGKGHEQYYLKLNPAITVGWEFVEWKNNVGPQITRMPLSGIKKWLYLTGVRNGTSQKLYVDGVCLDSTISFNQDSLPRNSQNDFSIGAYLTYINTSSDEGFAFFNGKIDEVRISSIAENADRIKLYYMNQKEQDALVQW